MQVMVDGVVRDATPEERAEIEARRAAAPSEAEIVAAYMAEVQRFMDSRAVEYGYDNIVSAITYAEEPAVERYQTEGKAFRAWRSMCWDKCEQVRIAVKAGERETPTNEQLVAEMPELDLPEPSLS